MKLNIKVIDGVSVKDVPGISGTEIAMNGHQRTAVSRKELWQKQKHNNL